MKEMHSYLSEMFMSIQGEGHTRGKPSVFARFAHCKFMSGGHHGDLVKSGEATWWCDSETVWRQGEKVTIQDIIDQLKEMGEYDFILSGDTNMILTGGEPTMPQTAKFLVELIKHFREKSDDAFFEIETNGSLLGKHSQAILEAVDQINCSPKLANSGVPKSLRINSRAIKFINEQPNSWFKFVVSSPKDWEEIQGDYLPLIDRKKIILMPAVDNLKDIQEAFNTVWLLGQKEHLLVTNRDHIVAWDQVTGV